MQLNAMAGMGGVFCGKDNKTKIVGFKLQSDSSRNRKTKKTLAICNFGCLIAQKTSISFTTTRLNMKYYRWNRKYAQSIATSIHSSHTLNLIPTNLPLNVNQVSFWPWVTDDPVIWLSTEPLPQSELLMFHFMKHSMHLPQWFSPRPHINAFLQQKGTMSKEALGRISFNPIKCPDCIDSCDHEKSWLQAI